MRRITITQGEHGWEYTFEGMYSTALLEQATKGVLRGWRRHAAKLKREEVLVNPPKPKPKPVSPIPLTRPGQFLGTQPQMPFDPGTGLTPHAPLREPDAVSMQPHPQQVKEIENVQTESGQQNTSAINGERESDDGSIKSTKNDLGESDPSGREVEASRAEVGEDVLPSVLGIPERTSTSSWDPETRKFTTS